MDIKNVKALLPLAKALRDHDKDEDARSALTKLKTIVTNDVLMPSEDNNRYLTAFVKLGLLKEYACGTLLEKGDNPKAEKLLAALYLRSEIGKSAAVLDFDWGKGPISFDRYGLPSRRISMKSASVRAALDAPRQPRKKPAALTA